MDEGERTIAMLDEPIRVLREGIVSELFQHFAWVADVIAEPPPRGIECCRRAFAFDLKGNGN
jgi:hypothetical protein